MSRTLHRRVELDELVSLGYEGLVQAAERFDATRGTAFSTFAYMRVRGAMYDGVAKLAPIPRGTLRGSRARMRKFRSGKSLTDREKRASLVLFVASHDLHDEEYQTFIVDEAPTPADVAASREIASHLAGVVDRLPPRKRHLVRRHYFDDIKLCDAGAEVGISKSWTSRVHAQALGELRGAMSAQDLAA